MFSVAVIEENNNGREKRFIPAHSSRVQSITAVKSRRRQLEGADDMVPTVRTMNARAQFIFFILIHSGILSLGIVLSIIKMGLSSTSRT